jgi:hypothetical protein
VKKKRLVQDGRKKIRRWQKEMAEQGNKQNEKLLLFLKHFGRVGADESADLKQVFRELDEDPEIFWTEWLSPLLAEGLHLDRACEVVLETVLRPN